MSDWMGAILSILSKCYNDGFAPTRHLKEGYLGSATIDFNYYVLDGINVNMFGYPKNHIFY